jgi:hypothetical protein
MKANGENKCSGHGHTWDGNFALYKPIVFMSKNKRKNRVTKSMELQWATNL